MTFKRLDSLAFTGVMKNPVSRLTGADVLKPSYANEVKAKPVLS